MAFYVLSSYCFKLLKFLSEYFYKNILVSCCFVNEKASFPLQHSWIGHFDVVLLQLKFYCWPYFVLHRPFICRHIGMEKIFLKIQIFFWEIY